MWSIVVAIVGSSLLAIAYVWRVVEISFFKPTPEGAPAIAEAPLSMLIPTWLLAGACLWFGIDASTTLSVARASAAFLLGGAP
jgi:multicomponent Na+:H+ antiporter subunit D